MFTFAMLRIPRNGGWLAALVASVALQAQPAATAQRSSSPAAHRAAVDTISPPSFTTCPNQLLEWVGDFGPILGNNTLEDVEKAQRLVLPDYGNGFVQSGIVYWDYIRAGGGGSVRLRAYAEDPAGGPGAFLGESNALPVEALDTVGGRDFFDFPAPVAFSNVVFLSLDLSGLLPGDTVAALGSPEHCAGVCGAWELWSTGIWNKVCDTWNLDKIDMGLQGVIDWSPTGWADPAADARLAWPVPATGVIHLPVPSGLDPAARLLVWDAAGRLQHLGYAGASDWLKVRVEDWPPGLYAWRMEGRPAVGRFVVQ